MSSIAAENLPDAQARFTAPADQLLAGEQITLMDHHTDAITH